MSVAGETLDGGRRCATQATTGGSAQYDTARDGPERPERDAMDRAEARHQRGGGDAAQWTQAPTGNDAIRYDTGRDGPGGHDRDAMNHGACQLGGC
jgi:hypothetical protein